MKKTIVLLFFQFIFINLFAQQEKILEGEFQTEFYDIETKEVAKKRAKENAIVNAMEKGFGTSVTQDNTLHLKNTNSGNKTETKSVFNSVSETQINGELIEELKVEFEEIPFIKKKSNGSEINALEIKCKVKIRARESIESNPSFNAFPLKCSDTLKCKSYSFKDKDSLLVYFKASKLGYICLFLDNNDESKASYIFPDLPDVDNFPNGYPVEAGKEYFFFSNEKKHKLSGISYLSTIYWSKSEGIEKLYVIFSPTPFEIPDLTGGTKVVPSSLSSNDFRKWLVNLRLINKQIEIKRIPITSVF